MIYKKYLLCTNQTIKLIVKLWINIFFIILITITYFVDFHSDSKDAALNKKFKCMSWQKVHKFVP